MKKIAILFAIVLASLTCFACSQTPTPSTEEGAKSPPSPLPYTTKISSPLESKLFGSNTWGAADVTIPLVFQIETPPYLYYVLEGQIDIDEKFDLGFWFQLDFNHQKEDIPPNQYLGKIQYDFLWYFYLGQGNDLFSGDWYVKNLVIPHEMLEEGKHYFTIENVLLDGEGKSPWLNSLYFYYERTGNEIAIRQISGTEVPNDFRSEEQRIKLPPVEMDD